MLSNKKIIISCSNAGSLINFRGKLIEALLLQNRVFVVTPLITNAEIKRQLSEMGVVIFETGLDRNNITVLSDLNYIVKICKIIKKVKPDIFFSYTLKPVVYGSVAATFCGVKNITGMLTGLGYSFTDSAGRLSNFITKKLMTLSFGLNRNLKIIFQNKDDHQELLDEGILSKASRTYIVDGSGVDLNHYNFTEPDLSKINFLMVSRLLKSKGVNEFYEAACIIKKKYPQVQFTLAGGYEGDVPDSIDEAVFNRITSEGVVNPLGWISDVKAKIRESTTVVLPSFYREGIPRSLLEALAMGRAIITTDMIGCRETVSIVPGKENGFCVPIKNSAALAEKMEFLINHPEKIKEFGKNGRTLAEERFDVEKVNARMLEIFEE